MTTNSFEPQDALGQFLPVNYQWPDPSDTYEFSARIQQIYRRIADSVNCREIGNYLAVTPSGVLGTTVTTVETITGQCWFGDASETQFVVPRQTFRKVINFGVLPNTATKSVAHGVTFDANTTMTRLYGTATDPAAISFLPLPHANTIAAASNITLSADGTNVNVVTGTNRTNFTRAIIVMEYLKNL